MFLTLARFFPPDTRRSVFRTHPIQLSYLLDEVWAAPRRLPTIPGPSGDIRVVDGVVIDALDLPTQPPDEFLAPSGLNTNGPFEWSGEPAGNEFTCPPFLWDHLIYAYLIESTGIVEIFAEVIRRFVRGETLGTLQPESISFVRATEQLFFRDPPPYAINSVVSEVRPFERTNRRNAYWRLFGMDLAHPVPPLWTKEGPLADWKTLTGPVNSDFRQKWNEFLRQVWLGIENRDNTSGPNTADPSYIALLARALKDMLTNRRRGGALAREELAYVTMLSWFHVAIDPRVSVDVGKLVDQNTSIVRDLQAQATSAADRLAAIGQRVGMAPALHSRELFDLAVPMSNILRAVELGLFDTEDAAATLFERGTKTATDMATIINNWQSATGERVKERPVGTLPVTVASAQPLYVPVPSATAAAPAPPSPAPVPAAVSANGNRR
jgi:hypothetical protein